MPDAFHPDLTAAADEATGASLRSRLHHVRAADVSDSTAQTTGMQRFAAISGATRPLRAGGLTGAGHPHTQPTN